MILCIEDEPELRADLVEELRDAGYETIDAANGERGLAEILRCRPDLVFCDVTMPVMNGIEVFQRLRREHRDLDSVRFVFLSALEDVAELIEPGSRVDGILTKPVDFDRFLAVARKLAGEPREPAGGRADIEGDVDA